MNHLWQSTIFALAASLLTLALRRNHARIRHTIWLAASLKFLIPFSLLVSGGSHLQWPHAAAPTSQVSRAVQQINQAFQPQMQFNAAPTAATVAPVLPVLWLCGFTGVLFFWYVRWRRVYSIVRTASPIELGAPVTTMSSPALLEPGVFGIFRPVLLLPAGIVERLTTRQLRAIIAHELCHVRRRDNLAAAIHMLVEAVFWFHPLVWWIGSRLVDERERACDEEVLIQGSEPEVYAEGILNVCRFYVESPLSCVSGVTGADLKKRIEAIMTHRIVHSMGFGRKLMLATAALVAIVVPVAIGILNAQSPAPKPQFEVASVKLNTSGAEGQAIGPRSPGTLGVDNFPLRRLIAWAYHVQPFQVVDAPGWTDSARYDITAKPRVNPGESTKRPWRDQMAEMGLMMQSLLEERSRLKVHRETREMPTYALTVAKGGAKLQPPGGCVDFDPNKPLAPPAPGEKQADLCGNFGMRGSTSGKTRLDAFAVGIADGLVRILPDFTGRVVLDKTGLTGKFNFLLEFAPNDVSAREPGDSSAPSLSTALEEQLGLKLESTKGPVEVLVIDHVERPSEN